MPAISVRTNAVPLPGIDRLRALANFARFLSANPAPDAVARALVLGALAPLRASAVFLFTVTQHPDHPQGVLNVLSTYGASEAEVATFSTLPIDLPLPVTESVSSGRLVVTEGAQMVDLFPLLQAPDLLAVIPERVLSSTLVCMPFISQGVTIGAASLFVELESVRTLDDLGHLQAIADVSTLWLAARGGALTADHGVTPTPMLTSRQRQILTLLAQGSTNVQIAVSLGYSVPTIKKDVQRIMALCGVRTRKDVPAKAEQFGLL
jgi:DNA-binding CsgD family transcriptional regulator